MRGGSRTEAVSGSLYDFDPPMSFDEQQQQQLLSSHSGLLERHTHQQPCEPVSQWFQCIVYIRIIKAIACHGLYCFAMYFIAACFLQFSFLHPVQALNCFSLFSLRTVSYGLLFTIFGALRAALFGFFVLRFDTEDRFSYISVRAWLLYFGSVSVAISQAVYLSLGSNSSEFSRFFTYLLIIAYAVASFYDIFRANQRLVFPIIEMRPYLQLEFVIIPAANDIVGKKLPRIGKWTILSALVFGLPVFGWSMFRILFDVTAYYNVLVLLVVHLFLHQIAVGLIRVFVLQGYEFPMPPAHAALYPVPEQQRTLLDALESTGVAKVFAFWDLRTLSAACYRRRQIIFSLSQPGGHPRNWNAVRSACMKQIQWINEQFENENERIRNETFASVTAPLRPQSFIGPGGGRPAMLLQTTWQKGDIRQRTLPRDLRKVDSDSSHPKIISFSSLVNRLKSLVHVNRHIVSAFEVYVGVLATESLSALICASLNEDHFGVVQKDLHPVISILLQLCNNLQKYMRSAKEDKVWQSKTCVPLLTSLTMALSRIRSTFPDGSISKRLGAQEASFFTKLTSSD